ncbi:alpha/beta hydrolase family protein [Cloacibacillus porcorum]|uniref:alpha/beta hydrolase n=1 Tax=Cloacibacillus porcorum TaxID=1197717 RepID=UPI002354745E|nr:alpha/beta hydrolase [Cloacibacillus porcorum]MCI5865504.1 alpha/beta hydrolase [Cloacibacillus porcorum]
MKNLVVIVLSVVLGTSLLFIRPSYAAGLAVKEIGSFYVGGESVNIDMSEEEAKKLNLIDSTGKVYSPNGTYETGQMYVNYVLLKKTKAKYPLMMWHGGGLCGSTYETTPDGRPGWQMFFLKAGHDVYISDSVERGRSGFSMSPYIFKTQPQARSKEEMWTLFRIGSEYNGPAGKPVAFPGTQFPLEYFDQFAKQGVPRWTDTDPLIYAAYLKYLDRMTTPSVVIAHSQGCKFAMQAAIDRPDKVKGVILLEPYTPLDIKKFDITRMKETPLLVIYGDFLPNYPAWVKWARSIKDTLTDPLIKAGGDVTWVDLPSVGIKGNGHELYLEKNSDVIAQFVQDWMTEHKLMK